MTIISRMLSDADFSRIRLIALEDAGLILPPGKRSMVESRIARRMRATNCQNTGDYIKRLSGPASSHERRELISVLTTNVTSFFREAHHFETLEKKVFPGLIEKARRGGRVRIWSAGASTGQEAFSLAMLMSHLDPTVGELDVRVLATDIDHVVLGHAQMATYPVAELAAVPNDVMASLSIEPNTDETITIPEKIRRLVKFKKLNIHDNWPMQSQFDVILCRNVVIYFDAAHQARLWPRFNAAMPVGGWLFLGHSERLHPIDGSGFKACGVTTYQKTGVWTGETQTEVRR